MLERGPRLGDDSWEDGTVLNYCVENEIMPGSILLSVTEWRYFRVRHSCQDANLFHCSRATVTKAR